MPLHHASNRHNGEARARRLELAGLHDGVHRLLLGRIDEAAGIDDDYLGFLEIAGVLRAPVSLMSGVARGPGQWMPAASPRIELDLPGPPHAILALPLREPAPVIIAHAFTVGRPEAIGGLRTGNYLMQVKLLMRESTVLAASVPLYLTVK